VRTPPFPGRRRPKRRVAHDAATRARVDASARRDSRDANETTAREFVRVNVVEATANEEARVTRRGAVQTERVRTRQAP